MSLAEGSPLTTPTPTPTTPTTAADPMPDVQARADARQCEDSAVTLFMDALKRGRQYVESEWGREY